MTFFRQILHEDLGCASYLLGDGGEAIVVDPRFDFGVYVDTAREQGLEIRHVVDTHDHADHLSGREALAGVTGATAHRPFRAADPRERDLAPGDELRVGNLVLRALKADGHRPEHLAFVGFDLNRTPEPWFVLTGDSLLVGDVARPDLAVDPLEGAEALYDTVRSLIALGDRVEVWPGHVGGSLCGGAGLSQKASSTIGYERIANPELRSTRERFVEGLVGDIPARPPNIDRIVERNRRSDVSLPAEPPVVSVEGLEPLVAGGATILDVREPGQFDLGHIPGSLNLPASGSSLGTRAGWALDWDEEIAIVAPDPASAGKVLRALWAVGIWNVAGIAYETGRLGAAAASAWSIPRVADRIRSKSVTLVDVRESSEQADGYLPDSLHLPLGTIGDGRSLPVPEPDGTVAVVCSAGRRSPLAASLLRRAGWTDVVRVEGGGVATLADHGIELETA